MGFILVTVRVSPTSAVVPVMELLLLVDKAKYAYVAPVMVIINVSITRDIYIILLLLLMLI